MPVIFQKASLLVRQLEYSDAALLVKWLSDPCVLEFYEGRDRPHDLQMVNRHFFDESDETEIRCLVEYAGQPIGYIQFYPCDAEEIVEYGFHSNECVYGIDQFIGEPDYWNRGIGTLLVSGMAEYLCRKKQANCIILDPQFHNTRAIRCYEKCGFIPVTLLPAHELHEGKLEDCLIMAFQCPGQ